MKGIISRAKFLLHTAWLLCGLLFGLLCLASSAFADDEDLLANFVDRSVTTFAPVDPAYGDVREELVGIIIDRREFAAINVYRHEDKFFLPVSLLTRMGVRLNSEGSRLYLSTPGGRVELETNYFRRIQGGTYFMDDLLDQELKVQWEFKRDSYALDITLPWWQENGNKPGGAPRAFAEPQFKPSTFGVTQARLDYTRYSDDNNTYRVNEMLLRGRLAEGSWRAEVIDEDNRKVRAEDYYWLRDFAHVQTLVGNQDVLINPLLPSIKSTGVHALYNSRAMEFNPYQDQTRNQYIRRLGIPVKDIEGIAQAGAIAELRINDRPTARVRVRLDGTYEFKQIQLPSLQFATVQVHILDQRSFVILEVQDFTQTPTELLLQDGQTVVYSGVGMNGNPLDATRDVENEAVFGLWRYGLSERVTLEAGFQSANGNLHEVAGITASLGKQWATSLSLGHHSGNVGYSADLFGRGQRWYMNLKSQSFQNEFRSQMSRKTFRHDFRYEYALTPNIALGAYGRAAQSGQKEDDFFLPGATWRFNDRDSLRVWPDTGGDYRVDLRTYHRQHDWFEFTHEDTGDRAEYRFYQNQKLEYFARLENRKDLNVTTAEIGAAWYPREFDDRSSVHASVLTHDGKFGYRFEWRTAVLPGLYSHLELRDEPVATEFFDPGLQLRWTLSLDFAFAGGRPIPGRNEFTNSRAGSIGGRLRLSNGESAKSQGIDVVSVLIDGVPHEASVNGSHFLLEDLLPGVYQVALSPEHLPMDLAPQQATYRVKVAPSATTKVNFMLRYEYGIAGQINDALARPVAGAVISIFGSSGTVTHSTRTDQYGYYRLSGLEPGAYTIAVAAESGRAVERSITIEDAYLFDVDFTIERP